MSEGSGDKDSSSSIASPEAAVSSTSAGVRQGLPRLGSSPTHSGAGGTHSGGEGEVSSSTSGEESAHWNYPPTNIGHVDDALTGDKNPFIGMSEEDISQIESVLCTEEGKKILQQTTLEELASPLNSMEEDGDEDGEEEDSDGGLDEALKLEEDDFDLDDHLLKEPLNLAFIGEGLPSFASSNPALNEGESKDGGEEQEEEPAKTEDEADDKNKPKPRTRPGTRRSTRIQDQEQRDMAEKIRKENLEKEQKAIEALKKEQSQSEGESDGHEKDPKQYNMRTKRAQRDDGRVEFPGKGGKGKGRGKSPVGKGRKEEEPQVGTEGPGSEEENMDDEPSIDTSMIEPMGKKAVTTRGAVRGRGRGRKAASGKKSPGKAPEVEESGTESDRDPSPAGRGSPARGRGRGRGRGARKSGAGRGKKKDASAQESSSQEPETAVSQSDDVPSDAAADAEPTEAPEPPQTGPKKSKGKAKKATPKKGKKGKQAEPEVESSVEPGEVMVEDEVENAQAEPEVKETEVKPVVSDAALALADHVYIADPSTLPTVETPTTVTPTKVKKGVKGRGKKKGAVAPADDAEPTVVKETDKPTEEAGASEKKEPQYNDVLTVLTSSESENEEGYLDEDDTEWGPEDDPERLWCICKKPYNNRFMVACDFCEEWYHGSCVGITKKRGKEMSKNKEMWFCPNCKDGKKKKPSVSKEDSTGAEEKVDESSEDSKTVVWDKRSEKHKELVSQLQDKLDALKKKRVGSEEPKSEAGNDVKEEDAASVKTEGSDIKAEIKDEPTAEKEKKKKKKKKETKDSKESKKESLLPASMKEKCTMCGQNTMSGSVYCSDECIVKHAQESLQLIEQDRSKMYGGAAPSGTQTAQERIVVFERKTNKILTGPAAPTESTLQLWLQKHPTYEVLRPGQQVGQSAAAFYAQRKEKERLEALKAARQKDKERREREAARERREAEKKRREEKKARTAEVVRREREGKVTYTGGLDPLRIGVRKSLRDNLSHRGNSSDDVMLSGAEIKKVALEIEDELFKFCGAVNGRYKSRYKALITGIKDENNKGLFRRILHAEIKPAKLVRMSVDQISSKELAKWNETKTEIELGDLDKEDSPSKQPTSGRRSSDAYTNQASWIVDPQADVLSSIIVDTTSSHGKHFFDLNCKICTGKQPEAGPPAKKSKVNEDDKPESTGKAELEYDLETSGGSGGGSKLEEGMGSYPGGGDQDFIHHDPFCLGESNSKSTPVSAPAPTSGTPTPSATTVPATVIASTPTSTEKATPEKPTPPSHERKRQPPIKPAFKPSPVPKIWKGSVFAPDVCKFRASAIRISGQTDLIKSELPNAINIMGRLPPENVFDYLSKVRGHASNREIVTIGFEPESGDQEGLFTELLTYLDTRKRCGVVGSCSRAIKDMYIVPLPAHKPPPPVLTPFDGPGLPVNRRGLILGVMVKQRPVKRPPQGPPGQGQTPQQQLTAPAKTWMYTERQEGENPQKRQRQDPAMMAGHNSKDIPKEHKLSQPKPAAAGISKDPRSRGVAASRDPRQRAQAHAQSDPRAIPAPVPVSPGVIQSPAGVPEGKKPTGVLDQAQPQNALQAAILARAKAQMEAAKAAKDGAMSPMSVTSPTAASSPGRTDTPPSGGEAEDYSSSEAEIDTMDIDDPIVQAYGKKRRRKQKEEEDAPYEPVDEEPYDPLCPDIPETEKLKHSKQTSKTPQQAHTPSTVPSSTALPTQSTSSIAAGFTQLIQQATKGTMSADVTAAMLATLAASSASRSLEDQRQLLQTLTNQVEEQKRILERQKQARRKKEETPDGESDNKPATTTTVPITIDDEKDVEVIEIKDELETPMSPDAEADKGDDTKTRSGSNSPTLIPIDHGRDAMATNVARMRIAEKMKKSKSESPGSTPDSSKVTGDTGKVKDADVSTANLDMLSALLSGRSFENLKTIVAKAQQVDPLAAKAELERKGDTDLRPRTLPAQLLGKKDAGDDELEAAMNDPGGLSNVGKYYEQEQQKKLSKIRGQIEAEKVTKDGGGSSSTDEAAPSSNPFGIALTSGVTGDVDYRQGRAPPGDITKGPLPPGMSLQPAEPPDKKEAGTTGDTEEIEQWAVDESNLPNIPGLGDVPKIPLDKKTDAKPSASADKKENQDKNGDKPAEGKRDQERKSRFSAAPEKKDGDSEKKEDSARRRRSRSRERRRSRSPKRRRSRSRDRSSRDKDSKRSRSRRSRSRDRRRRSRSRSRSRERRTGRAAVRTGRGRGRMPFGRFGPGGVGRVPSPSTRSRSRSPRRKDRKRDDKKDDRGPRGRDESHDEKNKADSKEKKTDETRTGDATPSAPFIAQTFDYGHGVGDAGPRPPRVSRFSDIDDRGEGHPPALPPVGPIPPPGLGEERYPPRGGARGGGRGIRPPFPPAPRPSLLGEYKPPEGEESGYPPQEEGPPFEDARRGRGRGRFGPPPPRRSRFGPPEDREELPPPHRGGRGGFPPRGRGYDRPHPPGRDPRAEEYYGEEYWGEEEWEGRPRPSRGLGNHGNKPGLLGPPPRDMAPRSHGPPPRPGPHEGLLGESPRDGEGEEHQDKDSTTDTTDERPSEGHVPVFPPPAPQGKEGHREERPPHHRRDEPPIRGRGPAPPYRHPEDYRPRREFEEMPESWYEGEDWEQHPDGPGLEGPGRRGRPPPRGRRRFDPEWRPPPRDYPPHPRDLPPPEDYDYDYPPESEERGGRRGGYRGRGRGGPRDYPPPEDWELGPPPPPPQGMLERDWEEGYRHDGPPPPRGRGRGSRPPRGHDLPPRGRGGRGRFPPDRGDDQYPEEHYDPPPPHPEDRYPPEDRPPRRGRPEPPRGRGRDGPPRGRGAPRGRFDHHEHDEGHGRSPRAYHEEERRPEEEWGEEWRGRRYEEDGPPRGRGRGRGWDSGRGRGRGRGGPP